MTRNKIQTLLAKPNVFSGTVRGIPGIWERTAKGLVLRVAYEKKARYRPRYLFYEIGINEGLKVWKGNFETALDEALRTAK
jgi:hypothetical protein